MSVHAGRPILGAIARTERGKQILTAEALHSWVHPWMDEPDPTTWWIDSDAGCALFLPEVAIDDDHPDRRAVLSIRGSVHAGGREKAPSAWHWLKQASGTA